MNRRRSSRALCWTAVVSLATGGLAAQSLEPGRTTENDLVYSGEPGQETVSFVPESMFTMDRLVELGFREPDLSLFAGFLSATPEPGRQCEPWRTDGRSRPWQILDHAASSEGTIAVGRASRVTGGYVSASFNIGSLVTVELEEVLRGSEHFTPGSLLRTTVPAGVMSLPNGQFESCDTDFVPVVGQRVVISGWPRLADGFFSWGLIVPVEGDFINLGKEGLKPLSELRELVADSSS